jgi:hypothetical protein
MQLFLYQRLSRQGKGKMPNRANTQLDMAIRLYHTAISSNGMNSRSGPSVNAL